MGESKAKQKILVEIKTPQQNLPPTNAMAVITAVSARNIRRPSDTLFHPDPLKSESSCGVHPPSGPTAMTSGD